MGAKNNKQYPKNRRDFDCVQTEQSFMSPQSRKPGDYSCLTRTIARDATTISHTQE